MSERNEKMAAMLAADAPAARDLGFEIAVMARIEQRRFVGGVMHHLAIAACMALVLALVAPQLDLSVWSNALAGLAGNTMVMLALLVAGFAAWHFRPVEA